MKGVLFLTESYHPVLGGGETHIRRLASRLVAAGTPATVLTRRTHAESRADEMLDGVRIVRVPPVGPGRSGKYWMLPAALAALRRLSPSHGVLVVRGTRVLGAPGLAAGRGLGLPVVLQAELNGELSGQVYWWGTRLDHPGPRGLLRLGVAVRNRWLRDADAFVAMSSSIRDEFLAAGVPPERVAWIAHGVDLGHFRPVSLEEKGRLRARLGLPAAAVICVYTGRLLRGKGLELLVRAFGACARRHPEAHLLLVGAGEGQALSIEADLRRQVSDAGLPPRVTFAGRVEDVAEWLQASDVFVFPSLFEALGLSLVEAAACGLACLGSRTGGIVDVIEDGASGLLVAPGDGPAWEAALGRLLAAGAPRLDLGRRARAVAEARFDLARSVARYQALFDELAARPAA